MRAFVLLALALLFPAAPAFAQAADSVRSSLNVIAVDSLETSARTVSELLQGRLPALTVLHPGASPGGPGWLRSRGQVVGDEGYPRVYVDGLLVDSRIWPTRPLYDPLLDLDPERIERIELLPGPAAGRSYHAGQGGVLLITTRRPAPGQPFRQRVSASVGSAEPVAGLPENVALCDAWDVDPTSIYPGCHDLDPGTWISGSYAPGALVGGSRWSLGWRGDGGIAGFGVALGARIDRDEDIDGTAGLLRTLVDGSVAFPTVRGFTVRVSGARAESDAVPTTGEYWNGGPLFDPRVAEDTHGVEELFHHRDAALEDTRLSVDVDHTVGRWFSHSFLAGRSLAVLESTDTLEWLMDGTSGGGSSRVGTRSDVRTLSYRFAAGIPLTPESLKLGLSGGLRRESDERRLATGDSAFIPWGTSGGAHVERSTVERKVEWLTTTLEAWGVRLRATATHFDERGPYSDLDRFYPSLQSRAVVWRSSTGARAVVRGAWGRSGRVTAPGGLGEFWISGYSGFYPVTPPVREDLEEAEAGFTVSLPGAALELALDAYRQQAELVPVLGFDEPYAWAEVRTEGLEATLATGPYGGPSYNLRLRTNAALRRSEVVGGETDLLRLDGDYDPVSIGDPLDGRKAFVTDVDPEAGLATIYARQYVAGAGRPVRELAVEAVARAGVLQLRLQVEALGGHSLYDRNLSIRDFYGWSSDSRDPESIDLTERLLRFGPWTPVDHESFGDADWTMPRAPYVQSGSFVRLREASVSLSLPEGTARALRLRRARLELAGRNLAVLTGYGGLDPEIVQDPMALRMIDFLTAPPRRTLETRLVIDF